MAASLKDRTVLVIGRAGGIAEAVCTQAKSQGANVVAAARETEDLDRAYAVMFALSNTFLTGVSLSIDGGETIV